MACPSDCTNCCATYIVEPFYNSHFTGFSFTLTPSGTCTWYDGSTYCAQEATIFCDGTDGWTMILRDYNSDCEETYSTGTFESCPPEEPFVGSEIGGMVWVSISASGPACYNGINNPPGGYLAVTRTDCSSSSGGTFGGVGLGNFFLVFPA